MERTQRAPDAEFLTVDEAARWLGIAAKMFRRWVRQKRVPPPGRFDGKLMYRWDKVVAMSTFLGDWLPLPPPEGESEEKKRAKMPRQNPPQG